MKITSLNGLFILKPYQQGQGIRTEMRGGLALPGQKLNLVALPLLANVKLDGKEIKQGSVAYIPEDLLMTSEWAKKIRKADGIEGEFIVVENRYVYAIGEESEELK